MLQCCAPTTSIVTDEDDGGDVSPPKVRQVFPSLFSEAFEGAIMSFQMFAVANVRRMARNGDLPKEFLKLPVKAADVREMMKEHHEVIAKKMKSKEYATVVETGKEYNKFRPWVDASELCHLDDENAAKECVYGITANYQLQTITVSFRGSFTIQDWVTDAKIVCGSIPNPLKRLPTDEDSRVDDEIGVHLGFRDYLYFDAPSVVPASLHKIKEKIPTDIVPSPSNRSASKENKMVVIMRQVQNLLARNPGFRIYTNGHSLGGALAVLTAVEAAVRFGRMGCPVTCVAVANPRAGDASLQAAIRTLEQKRLLRCLVIHNDFDLVPLLPGRVMKCQCFLPRIFCQQGIELLLTGNDYELRYLSGERTKLQARRENFRHIRIALLCWVRMAEQHDYRKYIFRLLKQKDRLAKLHLDDLYEKEGIIF